MQKDVIIISVPYCEPLPVVAPALLASCLVAAGISARGIDFNAIFVEEFVNDNEYVQYKNFLTMGHLSAPTFSRNLYKKIFRFTLRFLKNIVNQYQPKFIGLSIFTSESLDFGLLLSYLLRKYYPDIVILAGGKGLEITGENNKKHYEVWSKNNVADLIIVGDAESSIIDSIKHNRRGVVISEQQTKEDLDLVPLPQWDDYDLTIYKSLSRAVDRSNLHESEPYLTITASKGCVRQCTFCDVASFWPNYLYRDPEKVAREIIFNYQKTGIRKFKFTDNLINGSITNFRRINEVLVSEIPNTITYGGYAIFRGRDQMPESDFELAARAGNTHWSVGVESGSERVRFDMKKKFTDDDLDWSVRMLNRWGIQQTWLLIVGYPSETEEDFIKTKQMIKRYAGLVNGANITIQITPTFMMLNNSPLLTKPELVQEYGLENVAKSGSNSNKFWTSTRFVNNDFPTRARRWRELMQLVQEQGYQFGNSMPVKKWSDEMDYLEKIYHDKKIIRISTSQ